MKDEECRAGRCGDHVCKSSDPLAAGEPCTHRYECRSENCLVLETEMRCGPGLRPGGDPCSDDLQCASAQCTAGACGEQSDAGPDATMADARADTAAVPSDGNGPDLDAGADQGDDSGPSAIDAGTFCPGAVAPTDDFEDGVIDSRWDCAGFSGSSSAEAGGVLTFTFPNGIPRNSAVRCRIAVGVMTGRRFTVEIADIQASPGVWVYLKIQNSTRTQWIEIFRTDGKMNARTMFASSIGDVTSEPYSEASHRFWRLREAGGTIHFELSADGSTFGTLETLPTADVDLSGAELEIGAYAPTPSVKTPGSASFGSLCGQ